MKNFDIVTKIRELDRRVDALECLAPTPVALENVAPSANMDAGGRGANLYLGGDFSERLYLALAKAGYLTNGDLRSASDEELLAVGGVGSATLVKIRAALK